MKRPPTVKRIGAAFALAVLSAAALADDDFPKVTAPTTPPDLVLSCRFSSFGSSRETTVEVWNSGVVREEGRVESAQVTFARINILTARMRYPSGTFYEAHYVIDRVRGDVRVESRFVDANSQPASTPPEVKEYSPSRRGGHCQAAQRQF